MNEKLKHFWAELRRRKTVQTAVAYLIFLGAVAGSADDILGSLRAPDWINFYLVLFLILGFPVVVVLSWLFDFTLHGIVRTEDSDELDQETRELQDNYEQGDHPNESSQSSVTVESGTAHRHQVTLLRTTFVLTRNGNVIDEPETLLGFVPELEKLVVELAQKYSAQELNRDGTTFEFLFGFPSAYEDDAIRSVALALGISSEVGKIRNAAAGNDDFKIAAVSGVFSDFVIVDADPENTEEIKIVGSALQATTWIQSHASPGSTTLDQFTFELLRNRVDCELLGEFKNAQRGHATKVYEARGLRDAELDPSIYDGFKRVFVGRSSEVDLVLDRWERAKEGENEFVVLRGEPGIGKTTLVHEVTRRILEEDQAQILPLFCSPLERNTTFQPIIECMLGPGFNIRKAGSAEKREKRVYELLNNLGIDTEKAAPLITALLSLDSGKVQSFSESARKELIQYLLEIVYATAKRQKLVFVVEDLHWADPSTLEIVSLIVSDDSGPGFLCLFTSRPHLKLPWESRSNVTTLNLQALSKRSTRDLVDNFLQGLDLPDNLVKQLVNEAGGNPLFAEELAKAVYETTSADPEYRSHDLVLPGTLQRSLASRMDNLGSAKPLLQLCSLLGREFQYTLLKTVSGVEDEEKINRDLQVLVNAEFLYQRGTIPNSTYTFKHILMQETAYQSLLKSTRKDFHNRIAETLQADADAGNKSPEILAYHYEGAERLDQALQYWSIAAARALSTQSMVEAAELASNGLKVLDRLPKTRELDMARIQLLGIRGRALLTASGYAEPEVEQTFNDALSLCEEIGDVPQLFMFLVGLWSYFQIGGTVQNAEIVAQRLVRLAEADDSPAKKVQAFYSIGYTCYRGGHFKEALSYMQQAEALAKENDADYCEFSPSGDDGRIHNASVASHIYWQMGDREKSLEKIHEAIELAEELGNPVGKVFAYFLMTWLAHLDWDYESSIAWADKTIALAKENQLSFWIPNSMFIRAWACFHLNREPESAGPEDMLDTMQHFVDRSRAVGSRFGSVDLLITTAEALMWNGHIEDARRAQKEAVDTLRKTGELYLEPEAARVEAEIERITGDNNAAMELYKQAIRQARELNAVTLEQRAQERLDSLALNP